MSYDCRMTPSLAYGHGAPLSRALLRAAPADFFVAEQLAFSAEGSGEHALVSVQKTGANTAWVAEQLARFCGVSAALVSYAGMKDRHAVTQQSFSVHLPGKPSPDFSQLQIEGVRVLGQQRHTRKLQRGALVGNRFVITLREVSADAEALAARIEHIQQRGVPNYFGAQRFGHAHGNVDAARALFAGAKRVPRHLQSIYLSAARAEIFNQVLHARVAAGFWDELIEGDVLNLAGSGSVFGPEPITELLRERAKARDLHPTGPLWGSGALRSCGLALAFETAAAESLADLADGLVAHKLKQERRALRLVVGELEHVWLEPSTLKLSFTLPAGSYATTVVRELFATEAELVS